MESDSALMGGIGYRKSVKRGDKDEEKKKYYFVTIDFCNYVLQCVFRKRSRN